MMLSMNTYAGQMDYKRVTKVVYVDDHAVRGVFIKNAEKRKQWSQRVNNSDIVYRYRELYRTEGIVFLFGKRSNRHVLLDLKRKKVVLRYGHRARDTSILNIVKVSHYKNKPRHDSKIDQIDGRNVTVVKHTNRGEFIQTGRSTWTEYGKRGPIFTFKERKRDKWSVYLHDRSRNVNIQLDLYRKKVIYSVGNGRRSDLYDITNVSSRPISNYAPIDVINGYSVKSVKHANKGLFKQTGGKTWTEYGKRGPIFTFKEKHRDEWSVYLHDASRNVNIQLDLHRKKVIYSVGNGARSDLYSITLAR